MKNKPLIMIVEDEKTISDFLTVKLESVDYKVLSVITGEEAISLAASYCPDLILLDLGLPDICGMEVLKSIKKWSSLPIIIVSARQDENNIVQALDEGADDYITKPFNNSVLMARVRTALRKSVEHKMRNISLCQTFNNGILAINYDKRRVTKDNNEIHLTPIEYKIITILSQNSGRVMTYGAIRKELWGPYAGDNRILRVNMANLRRKIECNSSDPKYMLTEIGVGYRMMEADSEDEAG